MKLFEELFNKNIMSFYLEKQIRYSCILVAIKSKENIYKYYKIRDSIDIYEKAENNLKLLKECELMNQTVFYNAYEHIEIKLINYSIICSPVKKNNNSPCVGFVVILNKEKSVNNELIIICELISRCVYLYNKIYAMSDILGINNYIALEDVLTDTEMNVLSYLSKGLSDKDISLKLNMSYSTVRKHISNILSILGLSNRSQIINYYIYNYLVT